jgi:flagellar biosynthesis protein FlhB
MLAPRKIVLPVVAGVWIVTTLAAIYTWVLVQGISISLDFLQPENGSAIPLAGITRVFLRFHLVGVVPALVIFGYGVRLVRPTEASVAHLAWYASLSVSLVAFWQTCAMLADRCYIASFFP